MMTKLRTVHQKTSLNERKIKQQNEEIFATCK